jgi:antibiotic biosynthesis monooxygenase (ABM) superfamily enzyme
MFGSVFKVRPKSGKFDEMMDMNQREYRERGSVPGWQSSHVLRESNGDVWILAVFDSEESYRKNAASPEQDKRYRALRELLEADPEWHDGTVIEERPS